MSAEIRWAWKQGIEIAISRQLQLALWVHTKHLRQRDHRPLCAIKTEDQKELIYSADIKYNTKARKEQRKTIPAHLASENGQ